DVTRLEPAVLGEALGRAGVVVVAGRDPRAPHLELARGLAVPRELLVAAGPGDAGLHAQRRLADGGAQVGPAVVVEDGVERGLDAADRGDRAGLGHPPGLHDRQPGLLAVRLGQGPGHGRAAAGD